MMTLYMLCSLLAQHPLCERLELASLWTTLGQCLSELSRNSDQNAVLILQPAVEAFFLVHAGSLPPEGVVEIFTIFLFEGSGY